MLLVVRMRWGIFIGILSQSECLIWIELSWSRLVRYVLLMYLT